MTNLYGKVAEIRSFKWGSFIIVGPIDAARLCWQVVLHGPLPEGVVIGAWINVHVDKQVEAKVEREYTVQNLELHASSVDVLSTPTVLLPILLNEKEPTFSLHQALDHRGLSLQTELYRDIFHKQNDLERCFRDLFSQKRFTSIHTPKIVSEGAEGGTEVFSLDYFGKKAFLAQSPQFYKQICCAAFGKVYEVGPVFRAEKHNTSRHLNEYISLDIETILDPTREISPLLRLISIEHEFLQRVCAEVDVTLKLSLDPVVLSMDEAKKVLGTQGQDMSSAEEQEIGRWAKELHESDVVYLTHYHRDIRPFYTKVSEDGIHTESFDCLLGGMEITSGGQRANNHQEYVDAMVRKGLDPENFRSYLDNFRYGFPVHGGFAIGLERLTAKLCGLPSVKMASLFPRDVDRLTP